MAPYQQPSATNSPEPNDLILAGQKMVFRKIVRHNDPEAIAEELKREEAEEEQVEEGEEDSSFESTDSGDSESIFPVVDVGSSILNDVVYTLSSN